LARGDHCPGVGRSGSGVSGCHDLCGYFGGGGVGVGVGGDLIGVGIGLVVLVVLGEWSCRHLGWFCFCFVFLLVLIFCYFSYFVFTCKRAPSILFVAYI